MKRFKFSRLATFLVISGVWMASAPACTTVDPAEDDLPSMSENGSFALDSSSGGVFARLLKPEPNGTGGSDASGGSESGGTGGTGGEASRECKTTATSISADVAELQLGETAYTYLDQGGSCIDIFASRDEICVEGTSAQVVNDMWDTIFGAGFGILLAAPGEVFDASVYSGFKFTISRTIPELRAGVMMKGDTDLFFSPSIRAGDNELLFEDLANGSWVEEPGELDKSMLTDIQWHIGSTSAEAIEFEACVSNVRMIVANSMGGASGAN